MNSTTNSEKIEKILHELIINLQESWQYFAVAKNIVDWLSGGSYPPEAMNFFGLTHDACIRSFIITLSGLISKSKNSVNFYYFLNVSKDLIFEFKITDKKAIIQKIKEDERWLDDLLKKGAIGDRIIDKRDKTIAHLDRKFATQRCPDFLILNPSINSSELQIVYCDLMKMFNTYHYFYYGTDSQNSLNQDVTDNLQYILNLIPNEKVI